MSQSKLLGERRFLPFFVTQFLNAFNDNLFKNGMILLLVARPAKDLQIDRDLLTNLSGGLFILPFFLFSATAGQLADKFQKTRIIRAVKAFEVLVMLAAVVSLHLGFAIPLLALLFAMGVHSAFFGPVKLAILPEVLSPKELVGGNGLVEMGTYVAILGGTILAGLLLTDQVHGVQTLSVLLVGVALVGYAVSRFVPDVPISDPNLKINLNPFSEIWKTIQYARENRAVWLSVLGNSWFWFVGTLFVAQLIGFNADILHGEPTVYTTMLIAFSLGVGIGSLLCEKLSGGRIELGLVPFGSIGMTLFAVDLYFASQHIAARTDFLAPMQMLSDFSHLRILLDFLLLGAFGGFYSVPLFAVIQHRSAPEKRSRIIAALNIINALFMVGAAIFASVLLKSTSISIPGLFLLTGILNACVALYIYLLLPEFTLRFFVWILMRTMYRLRSKGVETIPDEGPLVLVCNHVSFVDALILGAAIPRPVRFVMWYRIYETPVLNYLFRAAGVIPIAGRNENKWTMERAFLDIDEALANGEAVCIFPEGKITSSGEINVFRNGVERIVATAAKDGRKVPVIPMALRGLWGSFFSRRGGPAMGRKPTRFRSKIELEVGAAVEPPEVIEAGVLASLLESQVRVLRSDMA